MFQVQVNLTVYPTYKWALHGWKFTRVRLYGCTAGPLAVLLLPSHGRKEVVHYRHRWETRNHPVSQSGLVPLDIFCLVFASFEFFFLFHPVSWCLFRQFLLTVSISLKATVSMCYRDVLRSYRSVHLSDVCLTRPIPPVSLLSPSPKSMWTKSMIHLILHVTHIRFLAKQSIVDYLCEYKQYVVCLVQVCTGKQVCWL